MKDTENEEMSDNRLVGSPTPSGCAIWREDTNERTGKKKTSCVFLSSRFQKDTRRLFPTTVCSFVTSLRSCAAAEGGAQPGAFMAFTTFMVKIFSRHHTQTKNAPSVRVLAARVLMAVDSSPRHPRR